jgi:hypothetical protein
VTAPAAAGISAGAVSWRARRAIPPRGERDTLCDDTAGRLRAAGTTRLGPSSLMVAELVGSQSTGDRIKGLLELERG